MGESLTRTLSVKLRISRRQIWERYHATIQTEHGPRKGLQVEVPREGKKPLVAIWGGITLKRRKQAALNDSPTHVWNKPHSELLERLLADECELCGSTSDIQVHHIRGLKDLRKSGRREKPEWVRLMAARRRKTLVVCLKCHRHTIHGGKYDGTSL
jgi:hypothetical protein